MKKCCSSCRYYWGEQCMALLEKGVALWIYSPNKGNSCRLYVPLVLPEK